MADFSTPLPQAAAAEGSAGGMTSMLSGLLSKAAWMELLSRVLSLSKSFFNPTEFSRPATQQEWITRVSSNASRFALIYFCLFLPFLLNTMMSSWVLLIGSLALIAMWAYAYGIQKESSTLTVFGVSMPKVLVCAVVSITVMLVTGMLSALIGAMLVFSLIGMPHMSLHVAPSGADALDALELQPVVSTAALAASFAS